MWKKKNDLRFCTSSMQSLKHSLCLAKVWAKVYQFVLIHQMDPHLKKKDKIFIFFSFMHLMIFTSQSKHLIEENDLMRKHSHFLVSVKLTILFFFFFFNKVGMHGALSFNGIILTNLKLYNCMYQNKRFS